MKFTSANTNRDEALKATNAVISRLTKVGRLQEFQEQIQEMEVMGTIVALTDSEIKIPSGDFQNSYIELEMQNTETFHHHLQALGITHTDTDNITYQEKKKKSCQKEEERFQVDQWNEYNCHRQSWP